MLTPLIVFVLCAIVDADQLTFVKMNRNIYVETDPKHYALFGQVMDKDGPRVIMVNGDDHYSLRSRCGKEWQDLEEVGDARLSNYVAIREASLKVSSPSPALSNIPSQEFSWSDTLTTTDKKKSPITRLDDDTLVYSSKYFPGWLARVIISGDVVIFVHYDGDILMRTKNCLYPSEKILVRGLEEINVEGEKRSSCLFPLRKVQSLKKYLADHPINEQEFYFEQDMKRHTMKGSWMPSVELS